MIVCLRTGRVGWVFFKSGFEALYYLNVCTRCYYNKQVYGKLVTLHYHLESLIQFHI